MPVWRLSVRPSGYLYYVVGYNRIVEAIRASEERIEHIRQHISVPICVGFGIRTAEDAAAIASTADGSIVGTVLVSQVESLTNDPAKIPEALQSILKPMREAMDANA